MLTKKGVIYSLKEILTIKSHIKKLNLAELNESSMTPVAKPFLPPKEEYEKKIQSIWDSQWLTNSGPLSVELEKGLENYFNVNNLLFVGNGTIALQIAIKALELTGEIITTPFSFVATSSCIVWENCIPVYVDIDSDSLNIDASKIEAAITDKTSAILATHVYGNSCDIDLIEKIAKKYKLKVIYDGAHAFGVTYKGKSIFEYGDISICSTHATKIFHTTEGGFVVANDKRNYELIRSIRNFGFESAESFSTLGINAKNSEFHAAMGLVNLNHIDSVIERRKQISELYDDLLASIAHISYPVWNKNTSKAYSYYPVLFDTEEHLEECDKALRQNEIVARRYFYPSLSKSLPYVSSVDMVIADDISSRILCLPLYFDLKNEDVKRISSIIIETLK